MKDIGLWSSYLNFDQYLDAYIKTISSGLTTSYRVTIPKTESRSGFNSGPSWKQLRDAGTLSPTAASLVKINELTHLMPGDIRYGLDNGDGTIYQEKQYFGNSLYYSSQVMNDAIFGGSASLESHRNHVRTKVMNKAIDLRFDYLTFTGEMHQTQKQIFRNAGELSGRIMSHEKQIMKHLMSLKISPAALTSQGIDLVANRWLEFAYGTQPLLKDMEAAGQAVADLHSKYLRDQVRAVDDVKFARTDYSKGGYAIPQKGVVGDLSVTYTRKFTYKLGADVTYPVDGAGQPFASFGLDWRNILPAAWELLPWSFLADYFLNIGDVLRANVARIPQLTQSWGVELQEDTVSWKGIIVPPFIAGGNVIRGTGEEGALRQFTFHRLVDQTMLPKLEFSSWDSQSLKRKFNMVALATVFLKKGKAARDLAQIIR